MGNTAQEIEDGIATVNQIFSSLSAFSFLLPPQYRKIFAAVQAVVPIVAQGVAVVAKTQGVDVQTAAGVVVAHNTPGMPNATELGDNLLDHSRKD